MTGTLEYSLPSPDSLSKQGTGYAWRKSVTMGKKVKQILKLWVERVNLGFVIFSGSLIAIMGFLLTYGATRRYAFNSPEPVSYEFSCMFLLLSFVLAIAAVEGQDRFLRCDLLVDRLPENIRNIILNIISPILGLTFFGIVTWMSLVDALHTLQIGQVSQSAWPVPLFPVKIFVPIGYGFLCLLLLIRLAIGLLYFKKSPREPQIGAG